MALRIKNNPASVNTLRHLGASQDALSRSLERLASGQKINKGADSPAGLVISENLRGQIAGVEQAIANSEFSISMVQTAEGALTEVNNLLIQMRQLALAAANEGANDDAMLVALQDQLANALESIDRVSANTRFGNKSLLDGSRGIAGVASGENLEFVKATVNTRTSPVQGYGVEIKQAASRAVAVAEFSDSDAEDLTLSITESGKSVTIQGQEDETAESFAGRLTKEVQSRNLDLDVIYNKDAEQLVLRHKKYGSANDFQVTSSISDIFVEKEGETKRFNNGQDVQGTINGEAAFGEGQILTGKEGNRFTDGLSVRVRGTEIGAMGAVSVSQNALVFQIGPNRGQQVAVAIDSTNSEQLARGVANESGFRSLAEVDITSAQGAQDTIGFVDQAIQDITRLRGELGAFQKNALESNVATMRVTAENLLAAESSIRDTDVAREVAEFTKQKILTQAASAAVAQANNIPTSSLIALMHNGG